MKYVALIAFVLLVVATAVMAERRAGLPPVARPAKRAMFASALMGALGLGGVGYTLMLEGPVWQLAAAASLALGGFIGIILSARAMIRALKSLSNPQ